MQVSFIRKSIVVTLGALALIGSTAIAGQAATIIKPEVGDATDLTPGQDIGLLGATDLTRIRGEISGTTDADLYKFTIDTVRDFTARVFPRTTNTNGNALSDSQLFLFDATGKALKSNDNISSSNPFSRIEVAALAAGTYFLGISSFDYDPKNAASLLNPTGQYLFPNAATGILNPRPVLTNLILAGWGANSSRPSTAGLYRIDVEATAVPTPALLPGLAALGFSAIRKRKAKAAVA
jgi:hypothetical protein